MIEQIGDLREKSHSFLRSAAGGATDEAAGEPGLLTAGDEQKVGWNGCAGQVWGGVPSRAIGESDGDEVSRTDGAYFLHPDVCFLKAVGAGLTGEFEGFGDGVVGSRVEGQTSGLEGGGVNRDLNFLNVGLSEMVEREVQTLAVALGFRFTGGRYLKAGLSAGVETDRAAGAGGGDSVGGGCLVCLGQGGGRGQDQDSDEAHGVLPRTLTLRLHG